MNRNNKSSSAGKQANSKDDNSKKPATRFPIVGVGASAGGFEALRLLLEAMPDRPNVAVVIVQHLARDKPSLAPALLSKYTAMQVCQVHDETVVQPNCVYIIPPGQYLEIEAGRLKLTSMEPSRTAPIAVDHFFRSLAKDQHRCAVGVILSGTGSDGTSGIKAIKEAGGFVIAQDPETAEHSGMPLSAIESGMVDQVLSPKEIVAAITRFAEHPYLLQSQLSTLPEHSDSAADCSEDDLSSDSLRAVISLLQKHAHRDFRNYKETTLLRRTRRRMCLHHIDRVDHYLKYLDGHPSEITALSKDLLISVTDFFRDAHAWGKLATEIIPKIVTSKSSELLRGDNPGNDDSIRIWIPGCATGEEAYTVSMLFLDEISKQQKTCRLQVFASDIDKDALNFARAGRYPPSIQADVSPARLKRYFVAESDGDYYHVNKTLRDAVVFADQDIISDPPFSQLDLICCRNLLIYLKPETQQKVIALFHFALQPGGHLMLGTAETIGRQDDLFSTINKRCRIFQRIGPTRHDRVDFSIPPGYSRREIPSTPPLYRRDRQITQLIQKRLFDIVAPRAILIDRHWQILYINGDVNPFLQHASGVPSDDLLGKLRSELKSRLRDGVRKAFSEKQAVKLSCLLDQQGVIVPVPIEIRLLDDTEHEEAFALIIFGGGNNDSDLKQTDFPETPSSIEPQDTEPAIAASDDEMAATIRHLENELIAVKDELQSSLEQFEISHEEYKASNEEVMSVNEELQSTNEELETSKEELQSLNEELSTVNQQLASKIDELETKHADLENLISATEIPTICLDNELMIRWFTPSTQSLIRMRPSDKGRPLCELASEFRDGDLAGECETVLKELKPIESEVSCRDGRVFLRRVLPYRYGDHDVGGVVVTMLDISAQKQREEKLRASEAQLRHALRVDGIGILFFDAKGRLIDCNDWFLKRTGYTRKEVQTHTLEQLNLSPPPEWAQVAAEECDELEKSGHLGPYEKQFECKNGSLLWMMLAGYSRDDGAIVAHCIDIGGRKRMEAELHATEQKLWLASTAANLGYYSYDAIDEVLSWSNELRTVARIQPDEPVSCDRVTEMIYQEDRERFLAHLDDALAKCDDNGYRAEFRVVNPTGEIRWIEDRGKVDYVEKEGKRSARFAVGMWMDITERKNAEESIRGLNRTLEEQVLQRTEILDILQTITRVANEARTVETAMRAALQRIAMHNGWLVGHLWRLCSEGSGKMESSGLWHIRDDAKARLSHLHDFCERRGQTRFTRGEGMIGTVMQTGEPQWVENASLDPSLHRISELGFRAAIAFPITVDGEVVAIMEFLSDRVIPRHDRFIEILPDVGIQLGHVMARKRLEEIVAEMAVIEQQRIGRELHDGIAQQLTGGALIAESLRRNLPADMESQLENVKHLSDILKQTHQDVRRLSDGLLPNSIDSVELLAALQGLASETTRRFSVPCQVDAPQFDESYITNDAVAFVIYQIACEAVHNAVKHAEANRIWLTLATAGDQFCMSIRDDGIGISERQNKSHTNGLRIMRYRAEAAGGDLDIESVANEGTSVTLNIPHRSCQS